MSKDNQIIDVLRPRQTFARSVQLERDFFDNTALDQYVLTEQVGQLYRRITTAFRNGSTERAWRITGDYGTGKSCFALLLARICDRKNRGLPKQLTCLSRGAPNIASVPVLVIGAREPISLAIIRALEKTCESLPANKRPTVLRRVNRTLRDASPSDRDRYAIELLESVSRFVNETKQANGLLLILDELGKSLEFATQNPNEQDITFLQSLAEAASRSAENQLVVLGILHQGFSAYANRMDSNDQREWDKIGGRFEELIFDQPLEQLLVLVAAALDVKVDRIPTAVKRAARENMTKAVDLGWFGAVSNRKDLIDRAPSIYPLQPMLLPVLVRFFSRFGQNERSLFSFLYSSEANALRSFAGQHQVGDGFFGIHQFYDYTRSMIGHRLHTRALSSRWSQIESVIDASLSSRDDEVAMMKTVGVLNMLDDQKLIATEEALSAALEYTCVPGRWTCRSTLESLRNDKRVLYYRGAAGGFCLWPYTSVNLELKYAEAEKVIRKDENVVDAVAEHVVHRPIVARRHYVKTGNLRHFDLVYVRGADLARAIKDWSFDQADGVIFVPLCQTEAERSALSSSLRTLRLHNRPDILVALPKPLSGFTGLIAEIRRWEWVATNVPELEGDKRAREEVSRQSSAARAVLLDRINQVLDVRSFKAGQGMQWFHKGKAIHLASSRELFAFVSTICDRVFSKSPVLRNELLNRRKLSSAAAAARMRLIERVLENANETFLGMDPLAKPPEMSMYLSALKNANLHNTRRSSASIELPTVESDTCGLLPLFDRLREVLVEHDGKRVPLSHLFAELRKKPIGARDGLLPLMLAVFCVAEAQHIAMYEDGNFLQDISGAEFQRLIKAPETFELQYCKLSGVRSEVFNQLLAVVDSENDGSRPADLIDVVRPLCKFAASLPDYSRATTQLSGKAIAVRDALMNATEPATLLFEDLPLACGQPKISGRRRSSRDDIKKYVRTLKRSLGEVRSAYPTLLSRIEEHISSAFSVPKSEKDARARLQERSSDLSLHVNEPTLKAFCLRIADGTLSRIAWLESLGSLVIAKPPRRWCDRDEARFVEALAELVKRFEDTASLAFSKGTHSEESFRLSVMRSDGTEKSRVMRLDKSEVKRATSLETALTTLIDAEPDLGITVLSKILLSKMESNQ